LLGLCLIKLIKSQYSAYFSWKPYPTRANPTGLRHLDLLTGIYQSERLFELTWVDFLSQIKDFTQITEWQRKVSSYLLY
jgi:4-hydroxyphenylpyruvate dioxygenase-like putative hemolysin